MFKLRWLQPASPAAEERPKVTHAPPAPAEECVLTAAAPIPALVEDTPLLMEPASTPPAKKRPSGYVVAVANEAALLMALHRFGWLTTRLLAAYLWPDHTQGIQMVRRTLRRLKRDEQVLVLRLGNGVEAYALSEAGAERLRVEEPKAQSGKDCGHQRYVHRTVSNYYLIDHFKTMQNRIFYSEYEIWTTRAPFHKWHNKIPDGLLVSGKELAWLEVEHCRRSPSDMQALVALIIKGLSNPEITCDLRLGTVHIVATDMSYLPPIARAIMHGIKTQITNDDIRRRILNGVRFFVLKISSGLVVDDYTLWDMCLMVYLEKHPLPKNKRQMA